MRLCELTMSERESLDKINSINLELEKSQVQSLANVVWAHYMKLVYRKGPTYDKSKNYSKDER